jgi:hypothetical protein
MVNYIHDLHSKNHIVILMGDFDDDLNMGSGQVNKMLRDCRLLEYTLLHMRFHAINMECIDIYIYIYIYSLYIGLGH